MIPLTLLFVTLLHQFKCVLISLPCCVISYSSAHRKCSFVFLVKLNEIWFFSQFSDSFRTDLDSVCYKISRRIKTLDFVDAKKQKERSNEYTLIKFSKSCNTYYLFYDNLCVKNFLNEFYDIKFIFIVIMNLYININDFQKGL